jgi:hypothetical protein
MTEFETFILISIYLCVERIMEVMSAGETSCYGKDTQQKWG